jgi:hypothetical protein
MARSVGPDVFVSEGMQDYVGFRDSPHSSLVGDIYGSWEAARTVV